jgi:O-antigen/teichoic acid export membrane protein
VSFSSNKSRWHVIKNILSLIGGRIFISFSRLLIALIIVRLAGADSYGSYVVVMSIIFIGEWMMDFGTTEIAVRNISKDEHRRISIMSAITVIKLFQAVISFSGVLLAIYLLGYEELYMASVVGGVGVILYGFALIYRVSFRINMTMYKDMMTESIGVMVMIVLVIIVAQKNGGVAELVVCYTISRMVYLLGNIYLGRHDYQHKMTWSSNENYSTLVKQASPLGITVILVTAYDSVFPLVLAKLMSMEAVAQYTVAMRFVFPIVLISQAINNVFYTLLAKYWATDKSLFVKTQQNVVEVTVIIACGFFCLIYGSADFLVSIFGESMKDSAWMLRAISWAILARAVTIAMSSPIILCGGQKKTMWLTLIVVIFSALLAIYLVPIYGIMGAIGAYLFVEIIITAIPVVFVSLYMAKYSLHWTGVIKVFFATAASIMMISYTPIDGAFLGSMLTFALFLIIGFITGGISFGKVKAVVGSVRNRID